MEMRDILSNQKVGEHQRSRFIALAACRTLLNNGSGNDRQHTQAACACEENDNGARATTERPHISLF